MRRKHASDYPPKDASKLKVGIVVSEWNPDITDSLLSGARETLSAWGVKEKNITVIRVAGSFELPYGCLTILKKSRKPNAILALGCIIKGETKHDEYIASAVANGIMMLTLEYKVPVAFGVVTTNDLAQAKARSTGKHNKGAEAAVAALEAALLD